MTVTAVPTQQAARPRIQVEKVDQQVATTLTKTDADRLYELCAAEGKKPAALIREIIGAHLDKVDRKRGR